MPTIACRQTGIAIKIARTEYMTHGRKFGEIHNFVEYLMQGVKPRPLYECVWLKPVKNKHPAYLYL